MWYFPLLQPNVDHVPVKADLSDLQEKIEWCRAHDEECEKIAQNARLLYDKYISREGILDYLQVNLRLPRYYSHSLAHQGIVSVTFGALGDLL